MNRYFDAIIVSACAFLTFLAVIWPVEGGGRALPPPMQEPGLGYLGQYLSTLVGTLVVVAIINRFRESPLNHWRAVMLTCAIVMVGNIGIVFMTRGLLSPKAYAAFLADVTTGGWLVLVPTWFASDNYRRNLQTSSGSD
jgi:hypothetical protein